MWYSYNPDDRQRLHEEVGDLCLSITFACQKYESVLADTVVSMQESPNHPEISAYVLKAVESLETSNAPALHGLPDEHTYCHDFPVMFWRLARFLLAMNDGGHSQEEKDMLLQRMKISSIQSVQQQLEDAMAFRGKYRNDPAVIAAKDTASRLFRITDSSYVGALEALLAIPFQVSSERYREELENVFRNGMRIDGIFNATMEELKQGYGYDMQRWSLMEKFVVNRALDSYTAYEMAASLCEQKTRALQDILSETMVLTEVLHYEREDEENKLQRRRGNPGSGLSDAISIIPMAETSTAMARPGSHGRGLCMTRVR